VADTEEQVNQPLRGVRVTGGGDDAPATSRSFEEFFTERFRPLMRWLIISEKAGFGEAEDAVTEAMTEALQGWARIRSPDAWVRVAAKRHLVRARTRVRLETPEAVEDEQLSQSPREDDPAVLDEEERYVLNVLDQLPPKQREVLAYSCDSYEPAEIAMEIGANPATVRRNLSEARVKAAKLVEASMDEIGKREIQRRREA
jgi:RNA polymerase sigma factor (sigma-70 family)